MSTDALDASRDIDRDVPDRDVPDRDVPDRAPRAALGEPALLDLVAARHQGVLATVKKDGRPQLSNVLYAWDPEEGVARVSVTADRAKTRNAARDPRVSLHVSAEDFAGYAVVEGDAGLSTVALDPTTPPPTSSSRPTARRPGRAPGLGGVPARHGRGPSPGAARARHEGLRMARLPRP